MKILSLWALAVCPLVLSASSGDLEQGKAVFRSNCAFCHGLTGRGGRGPNLVSNFNRNMKEIVRNGIPGTTMPAFRDFEEADLERLELYIRHLSGGDVKPETVDGDPQAGRRLYVRNGCASCHRIGSEGSIYGPELSRIGAARSVDYLRESILKPSLDVPPEYEGVTVVAHDGRRTTGVRVNEDTFSVQLRDLTQGFRLFQKDEVKQVIHESASLMPAYDKLTAQELNDLLAYLKTLRGEIAAGGEAKQAEGIR
ncbi:MAG: c-type cytochrome [Bryobacterales bacterium]|nr:c-type cytochrome [Bryobacterales bacterium]